jgi:hypothetical protein
MADRADITCTPGCVLCGLLAAEPWWLGPSSTTPARWRLAYRLHGLYGPVDRDQVIDACERYAARYGDAALAEALRLALSIPATDGVDLSVAREFAARLTRGSRT